MSCADLIAADKSNCYNYGEECCETCGVIAESYTNLTGKMYFLLVRNKSSNNPLYLNIGETSILPNLISFTTSVTHHF